MMWHFVRSPYCLYFIAVVPLAQLVKFDVECVQHAHDLNGLHLSCLCIADVEQVLKMLNTRWR